MSRPRAVVVVTGSELVRGDRTDRNGPFLAREALKLGLEPARVEIVGDAPDELLAALEAGLDADLCVTSGGLGPTHDDRTVELLAAALGRPLVGDEELRAEIEAVSRGIAERLRRPYADFEQGVRKQAQMPEGAVVVGLAGTAPALVVEHVRGVVVVLPGPPGELRRLWPRTLETDPVRRLLARARPPQRRVLRFFGASESSIARAFEDAGGDGDGIETTICARDFEIHVDLVVDAGAEERADELERRLAEPLERFLFSRDERSVEEIVVGLCRSRGLTLAAAESCTGGMVAARLTDVAGASEAFVGGIVAYSDELKRAQLGVPAELLAKHGAVSAATAEAMAEGARRMLGADVGLAVTGIAGPGGGTPEKPVGLVFVHAAGPDGSSARELTIPGDRADVRGRATVIALHLVRRLLSQSRHEDV
ncbi:MAG TPA: competence/damage-inducible protein A [Gaiellaceae bacterium]|nr:competence/damage-inducible protein A [Gaiellaceae bacterium]